MGREEGAELAYGVCAVDVELDFFSREGADSGALVLVLCR